MPLSISLWGHFYCLFLFITSYLWYAKLLLMECCVFPTYGTLEKLMHGWRTGWHRLLLEQTARPGALPLVRSSSPWQWVGVTWRLSFSSYCGRSLFCSLLIWGVALPGSSPKPGEFSGAHLPQHSSWNLFFSHIPGTVESSGQPPGGCLLSQQMLLVTHLPGWAAFWV